MGYCIDQVDCFFNIRAENKAKALFQVKEKLFNRTIPNSDQKPTYRWICNESCKNAETLEDLLEEWRYYCDLDADDNIISVIFEGDKMGDEPFLFKALAPFVEPGSWIEMHGEDGEIWRECFDGTSHITKYPNISWD